jgi:tRNA G18 (ribose-2'-O)-methylase SpoU
MRGYFTIGIFHGKNAVNVGTLWRSAHSFNASGIFTVGKRYKKQGSDTTKAWKHLPLHHYENWQDFLNHLPHDCRLVGVEIDESAKPIRNYSHPERACYLLGAEDNGLPPRVIKKCHDVVQLPGEYCLNVSTAGSIVMFDRLNKE